MSTGSDDSEMIQVRHYLHKHFRDRVPDSSTALNELYVDSLELLETLFELEQHTGKTLSNLELASLSTLGDLIRFFSQSTKQEE